MDKSVGGYIPASSFSKKGFAKNREQALANRGKVIKVWGYVDSANVFSKEWEDDSPEKWRFHLKAKPWDCLLYTSPSPRDKRQSRMPSSA